MTIPWLAALLLSSTQPVLTGPCSTTVEPRVQSLLDVAREAGERADRAWLAKHFPVVVDDDAPPGFEKTIDDALYRVYRTHRGKVILDKIVAGGATVSIRFSENEPGVYRGDDDEVAIDPTRTVGIEIGDDCIAVSVARRLGHELGHAAGFEDEEEGSGILVGNVALNENPIAHELGEPDRPGYGPLCDPEDT